MKTFLITIMVILPIITFAQFPSPENFVYTFDYIMIDDWGECGGEYLQGPTYCSHFAWNTPDTSGLSTILEYYNIYVFDYDSGNTNIIASLTDTTYHVEMGIVGDIWVTAVYSNPDGESEPSNIETNTEIPIIVETTCDTQISLNYNRNFGILKIYNSELINNVKIYNINGILKKSINCVSNEINLSDLQTGLYVIEIFTENLIIRKKIIK